MKLDFTQIPESVLEGFKGGKGILRARMHTDGHGKIMKGCLAPDSHIGLHTHTGSGEIIYILSGAGKVLYDGAYETLVPGDCHYCPEGHEHSLINDGQEDLCFLAVVPEYGG